MIYDCYVIRTNQDPIRSMCSTYGDTFITVIFINPETYTGSHMRRHHNVYCDSHFKDDKAGQLILKEIIKPLASLENSKFIFI